MPFNSLKYFLFLPVVYLVFYFVGNRARWVVLLAASYLFYAALNAPYLLIVLALVTIITYSFGLLLGSPVSSRVKLSMLWGGIAANVIILIVMKYLPFLSENLKALLSLLSPGTSTQPTKAFISIGVSFYIFQAISYLIDIYLEVIKPERHFGYFALSLAFFPKILQGPIERSGNLLTQVKAKYEFNYDNMRYGLLLFVWGLFKKVVIADRITPYVDTVYGDVHGFAGLSLILATYAYAFQIYMDFSGYTDMALGSARLFNIKLTQNFNSPYTATSVAEFWRRWHISFSSWILDYIFKPLQMQWRSRRNWGTASALMVTFLISGIWHGVGWGFVIWGLLHGLYLSCSVFYKPVQKGIYKALGVKNKWFLKTWQIFGTFNLVSFAWIFFRANDLREALYVISNIFNGYNKAQLDFILIKGKVNLIIILLAIPLFYIVHYARTNIIMINLWHSNKYYRAFIYISLVALTFLLWKPGSEFIYFRF